MFVVPLAGGYQSISLAKAATLSWPYPINSIFQPVVSSITATWPFSRRTRRNGASQSRRLARCAARFTEVQITSMNPDLLSVECAIA